MEKKNNSMNKKLITGMLDRLGELLDENEEIFFAERPFLEDSEAPKELTPALKRISNQQDIDTLAKKIKFEVSLVKPTTPISAVQTNFPIDL